LYVEGIEVKSITPDDPVPKAVEISSKVEPLETPAAEKIPNAERVI
jgi:hypothetical protein